MLNKVPFRPRMFIGLAACILAGTLATAGAYAMLVGLVAPPNWWFILILLTGAALRAVTYKNKTSAEG